MSYLLAFLLVLIWFPAAELRAQERREGPKSQIDGHSTPQTEATIKGSLGRRRYCRANGLTPRGYRVDQRLFTEVPERILPPTHIHLILEFTGDGWLAAQTAILEAR